MSRIFLDTNFLAYMYDARDPVKQDKALRLMSHFAALADVPVISTQVQLELFNTLTRKLRLTAAAAYAELQLLAKIETAEISRAMPLLAMELMQSASLSIWDALIVVTARNNHCTEIWSEDMQDGRKFGDVEIVNPFLRR